MNVLGSISVTGELGFKGADADLFFECSARPHHLDGFVESRYDLPARQ